MSGGIQSYLNYLKELVLQKQINLYQNNKNQNTVLNSFRSVSPVQGM